jgi:nucleotide-binding universal stress UspA family protein
MLRPSYKNALVAVPPLTHEWYRLPVDAIRRAAAAICQTPEVSLTFLAVFSVQQEMGTGEVNLLPPEDLRLVLDIQEKKHRDSVAEYLKWFTERGIAHTIVIAQGAPDEVIVQKAQEMGADLIIMGHHKKASLFDIFSSDVAERVAKRAPCDVMIIAPGGKMGGKA